GRVPGQHDHRRRPMTLRLEQVHSCYGKSHILQGVTMSVGEGELVTLLGRNGAGKSTTLKTIAGLLAPTQGAISFRDRAIGGRAACAWCPSTAAFSSC